MTTVVVESWSGLTTLNAIKQAINDAEFSARVVFSADPETVYVHGGQNVSVNLLETTLSDGSKVYDVHVASTARQAEAA